MTSIQEDGHPWRALWALCLGFFMILVDSTIVSVATPSIIKGLHADINSVIWVTSAYLLAYAVPLLITGRLGDRFGPKYIYLVGLMVFTGSSAWCGFSGTVHQLIVARVFQGLGAALMTPQTMSVITRTFHRDARGKAMGMWGAVAGVATLVGPLLGGILTDKLGWEWIFFINVPVGVIGFVLAVRLVPKLATHTHRFDLLGVALSAVGLFLVVFGIQEGETYHWGKIWGPIHVWGLIIAGIIVLAAFTLWQARNRREPLLPLGLFTDRNFSLANIAITSVGFAIVSMALPFMLYLQDVRGESPIRAALVLVPMAVLSGALAPLVGRLVDTTNPKYIAGFGLICFGSALVWLGLTISPTLPMWRLLLPVALLGLGNSCVWSPLSTTATRNLPPASAGAGSGVYNTTRQIGAVLGSAAISALMQSRLAANLPVPAASAGARAQSGSALPGFLRSGFATAMGQSLLLPGFVLVVGLVAVAFLARPIREHVRPVSEQLAGADVVRDTAPATVE